MSKKITKVVRRMAETKQFQHEINRQFFDYQIDTTDVISLMPQLTQGTTQSTRIGNKVSPVSVRLKLSLTVSYFGGNASPTYVDVYIFKMKSKDFYSGKPTNADMSSFLQDGSAATPYVGAELDGLRPVNSDMFTIVSHKRITLFNPNTATATYAFVGSINPNKALTYNLTKFYKKALIYDDNTSDTTNDNLYLAVGGSQTDGSIPAVNYGTVAGLLDFRYKDF